MHHVKPGYKLMSVEYDADQPCNPKFNQSLVDQWGADIRAQGLLKYPPVKKRKGMK